MSKVPPANNLRPDQNLSSYIDSGQTRQNAKVNLLVVDDDALQLDALCSMLGVAGFEVTGCGSANDALALLASKRFELLLSDLNMPDGGGVELVRMASALDRDMVSVLMTGNGSIESAVSSMKVGAIDYVLKPFRLSRIWPTISRALEVRRLRIENRKLQEKVAQRTAELVAANNELDALAGRLAHDLRAPLQIMQSFANFLAETAKGRLTEQEQDYLQRIAKTGSRAYQLVKDLLAFARLGDQALKRETVSLDEIFEQARNEVTHAVAGVHGRVEWLVQPLPHVYGDRSLLLQVFVNLLSNAIKFSASQAVSRIVVEAATVPAGHEIRIRDNGVGFDEAHAHRLFGPFQRLHRQEDFAGTGMGLANVKRIVTRHDGTITAHSHQAEGAEFILTLPAAFDGSVPPGQICLRVMP